MNEQTNPILPTDAPTSAPMSPSVQSPPPVTSPSAGGPKPARSMRVVWMVLIGIVVLAGAAYGWMKLYPSSPVALESASPSPSAIVDSTTGWKTYTNTQYGFEFKHPADMTVELDSNYKGLGLRLILTSAVLAQQVAAHPEQFQGEMYTYDSALMVSATTLSDATPPPFPSCAQHRSTIIVGSSKAISFDGCDFGGPTTVQWVHNGFLYTLTPATNSAVLQSLSTFKFTDATAGWKTYTNTPLGFELRHPETWKLTTEVMSDVGTDIKFIKQLQPPVGYLISVTTPTGTLQQFIARFSGYGAVRSQTQTTFAGKPATKIHFVGGSGFTTDVIYIPRDLLPPLVITTGPSSYAETDQILSTFKFTR